MPTASTSTSASKPSPRRHGSAVRFFLLLGAAVGLVACGDSSTGAGGAPGGLDGPDVPLTAEAEDVFTVGALDGEDWETFGNVRSVSFDAAGNLHVFDPGAHRVVVVGPDGALVRTVGQQGDGPGEIGNPMAAALLSDGRLAVFDFGMPGAFELFGPDGAHVETVSVDITKGIPGLRLIALPDSRLLTAGGGRFTFAGQGSDGEDEEAPEENRRPLEIFSLDGTGPEQLYQAWDLPPAGQGEEVSASNSEGQRRMVMSMSRMRAFEPGLHFGALSDGRVAVADSLGWRVKLLASDGSVAGTLERPIAPAPATASVQEQERARREAELEDGATGRLVVFGSNIYADPAITEAMRRGIEEMIFADEIPVIANLAVDWDDRIWVARSGPLGQDDGPTDIATASGEYVGTLPADGLRIPDAFGPGGLMAYVESDELGIETVRVVRLASLER